MTSVKNAEQICFERLAKFVGRHFFDGFADKTDSGIIYQNIYAAENANAFVKHHSDLSFAADIADFAVNLPVRGKFFERAFEIEFVARTNENFCAGF